jgi:hypothetical protein
MKSSVKFDKLLIAPCGMNCGTCIGYLRDKNKCSGCRSDSGSKPKYCFTCKIATCALLKKGENGFCYKCDKFPCQRLRQLDKRYRTKYRTSFIENLLIIKETGITNFLDFEAGRRTCPGCGSVTCVHKQNCIICKIKLN